MQVIKQTNTIRICVKREPLYTESHLHKSQPLSTLHPTGSINTNSSQRHKRHLHIIKHRVATSTTIVGDIYSASKPFVFLRVSVTISGLIGYYSQGKILFFCSGKRLPLGVDKSKLMNAADPVRVFLLDRKEEEIYHAERVFSGLR